MFAICDISQNIMVPKGSYRNMSGHAFMGCPDARLETMTLMLVVLMFWQKTYLISDELPTMGEFC